MATDGRGNLNLDNYPISSPFIFSTYTMSTQQPFEQSSSMAGLAALAATGKKRKRLQRACVACHKAKRRCDGGLPCSNCDFSGRLCSYSDSQGKTVSPTKRTLKPSEAAMQEQKQYHISSSSAQYPQQNVQVYTYGSPSSRHTTSPSTTHRDSCSSACVEPSLESRRELLSIFFSRLSPMSSVFDEISFLRDLSSMEVSPVLLNAMYAVSSSHAYEMYQHPSTVNAKYSKLVAEAGNGSKYVKEARRLLYDEDEHTGQSMIDGRANLETAQSLYLLAFYEFSHGHYFRASTYIQLSSKHITTVALEVDRLYSKDNNDDSNARALMKRNIRRLTCLVTAMDVSISMMNGQSMSTKQWNVEAAIDASSSSAPSEDDDEETVTMTKLLHISLLLNTAIELRQRRSGQSFETTNKQASQCQQDVRQWAERLPHYLQFDETRLNHVEQILNDRTNRPRSPNVNMQMNKGSAVCWTLMHSMAETTTLLLQELTNHLPERSCKLAACNNLVLLLEQSNPASLPRVFASFSVSVLYSVSCTVTEQGQDREWERIWSRARTFAVYVGLGESVWANMASWWEKRGHSMSPQRSPTSSSSGRRLPIASSPSLQSITTASSHHSSLPSPPPLSNSSYHYLHPLAKMTNSAPILPPLRLSISSEGKASRHFWDQPQRASMTVNPS